MRSEDWATLGVSRCARGWSLIEADLSRIKVALAVMSNAELDALIKATYRVEQIAPRLLAWLDSACVWQLQRRNG